MAHRPRSAFSRRRSSSISRSTTPEARSSSTRRNNNYRLGARGSLMAANPVLWNLDERGVATVTLNRPEVNNAYDAGLIGGVLSAMDELSQKPLLRVVVLKGNGKHVQAGADLKWLNGVRPQSPDGNEAGSRARSAAL